MKLKLVLHPHLHRASSELIPSSKFPSRYEHLPSHGSSPITSHAPCPHLPHQRNFLNAEWLEAPRGKAKGAHRAVLRGGLPVRVAEIDREWWVLAALSLAWCGGGAQWSEVIALNLAETSRWAGDAAQRADSFDDLEVVVGVGLRMDGVVGMMEAEDFLRP